jgi:hypothetical protein
MKRPGSTSTTAPALELAPGSLAILLAQVESLAHEARAQVQTPPPSAGLTLSPVELDQVARLLGLGARPTAATILLGIERLAALHIGDVRVSFTPGQMAELQHRAGKRGRTIEAEMQAVVRRIEHELFYQGG